MWAPSESEPYSESSGFESGENEPSEFESYSEKEEEVEGVGLLQESMIGSYVADQPAKKSCWRKIGWASVCSACLTFLLIGALFVVLISGILCMVQNCDDGDPCNGLERCSIFGCANLIPIIDNSTFNESNCSRAVVYGNASGLLNHSVSALSQRKMRDGKVLKMKRNL